MVLVLLKSDLKIVLPFPDAPEMSIVLPQGPHPGRKGEWCIAWSPGLRGADALPTAPAKGCLGAGAALPSKWVHVPWPLCWPWSRTCLPGPFAG